MSVFRNYQLCHCSCLVIVMAGGRMRTSVRLCWNKCVVCCVYKSQRERKTSNRWEFLGDFETRFRSVSMTTSLQNWAKGEYIYSTSMLNVKNDSMKSIFPRPHTLRPVIAGTAWRMCWRAIAQAEVCKVVNKTTQVSHSRFSCFGSSFSPRRLHSLPRLLFSRSTQTLVFFSSLSVNKLTLGGRLCHHSIMGARPSTFSTAAFSFVQKEFFSHSHFPLIFVRTKKNARAHHSGVNRCVFCQPLSRPDNFSFQTTITYSTHIELWTWDQAHDPCHADWEWIFLGN